MGRDLVMKVSFCKIFDLETNQVLVRKCYDFERNAYHIVQETALPDATPQVSLYFKHQSQADDKFNRYSENDAKKFIKHVTTILN